MDLDGDVDMVCTNANNIVHYWQPFVFFQFHDNAFVLPDEIAKIQINNQISPKELDLILFIMIILFQSDFFCNYFCNVIFLQNVLFQTFKKVQVLSRTILKYSSLPSTIVAFKKYVLSPQYKFRSTIILCMISYIYFDIPCVFIYYIVYDMILQRMSYHSCTYFSFSSIVSISCILFLLYREAMRKGLPVPAQRLKRLSRNENRTPARREVNLQLPIVRRVLVYHVTSQVLQIQ